ncbi:MAG: HAD family hydrolase [Nitrospinae bacterium]|nr:HAD family hydrolase [Nitrospinota bacterium]
MHFELIIFDCDGVLVDSEPIANRVLMEILSELGLRMTYEECVCTFIGRSAATCMAMIEARIGRLLPEQFLPDWDERLLASLQKEVKPIPGVIEALDQIRLPVCVASSSSHERMRLTLAATGLLTPFEGRLFSATEVVRGKPYPDLFLHAARGMGVPPGRCAVVEDSRVGVEAGIAAGMVVFGYAGGSHSDPKNLQSAGATVFVDMAGLPQLLQSN